MDTLRLGPAEGTISVHTGVAGGAARVGHSLVIVVGDWEAAVRFAGSQPTQAALTADVESMIVESGSGGLRPLSESDKGMIHNNAMRSLKAKSHPQIKFESTSLEHGNGSAAVAGTLFVAGRTGEVTAQLQVEDRGDDWHLTCSVPIVQSAYGIKPYSLMFGQLRVADEVTVRLALTVGKALL